MQHVGWRHPLIVATAILALVYLSISASPVHSAPPSASLSVLNLVSGDAKGTAIDVYADKTRLTKNLKAGKIRGFRMSPGAYDIAIYDQDSQIGKPVLRLSDFTLKRNDNVTLVIHADESGTLAHSTFRNGTAPAEVDFGRLTIRHVAAAPEVNVEIEGETLFINLANRKQVTGTLPAGLHAVRMVLAQSGETLLSDRQVVVDQPMNTIVYLWGSSTDGYRLASHRVGNGGAGPITRGVVRGHGTHAHGG